MASDDYTRNRLANVDNRFQGEYKRVLCVCSAGLLRSPTAAFVLSNEPFNFNTRAAGITKEYALVPVDKVLISWANEIVCMEMDHFFKLRELMDEVGVERKIVVLDIKDEHDYRSPELMKSISENYERFSKEE